jgi:hypothetical protein
MTRVISGKFDSPQEARRAASRLQAEGVPAGAMEIVLHDEGASQQPEGLRGITDRGATGGRRATLSVWAGDGEPARDAARLLQAAGAHDVDDPATARSTGGLGAAGTAFGMAIAEAATAPMAGATASNAQGPSSDTRPIGAARSDRKGIPGATGTSPGDPEDSGGTGASTRPAPGRREP